MTQNYIHTFVRDSFELIISDGEMDEKRLEALKSYLIQFDDGTNGNPIDHAENFIVSVLRSIEEVENVYPHKEGELDGYLESLYRIANSSIISEELIDAFIRVASRANIEPNDLNKYIESLVNKSDGSDNKQLVNAVKKISENPSGVFAQIYEDLGAFIDDFSFEHIPPGESVDYVKDEELLLLIMAYAYARRTAGACLNAQGIHSNAELDHCVKVFQSIQIQTIHTKEFQQHAAELSHELIQSYDHRLSKNVLVALSVPPIRNIMSDEPDLSNSDLGIILDPEDMILRALGE